MPETTVCTRVRLPLLRLDTPPPAPVAELPDTVLFVRVRVPPLSRPPPRPPELPDTVLFVKSGCRSEPMPPPLSSRNCPTPCCSSGSGCHRFPRRRPAPAELPDTVLFVRIRLPPRSYTRRRRPTLATPPLTVVSSSVRFPSASTCQDAKLRGARVTGDGAPIARDGDRGGRGTLGPVGQAVGCCFTHRRQRVRASGRQDQGIRAAARRATACGRVAVGGGDGVDQGAAPTHVDGRRQGRRLAEGAEEGQPPERAPPPALQGAPQPSAAGGRVPGNTRRNAARAPGRPPRDRAVRRPAPAPLGTGSRPRDRSGVKGWGSA